MRFPPLWVKGWEAPPWEFGEAGAQAASLPPPHPRPSPAGPTHLPLRLHAQDRSPTRRGPHPHPQGGGDVYRRCSLGPRRTATRCPLVAAAGTAGWRERKAARREPELSDSAPGGEEHAVPAAALDTCRPQALVQCHQGRRQSWLGPRAPLLTTWSGPGTRRSSRAAQRSRSGGGRGEAGAEGEGLWGGASGRMRDPRNPADPSPQCPGLPQLPSVPPYPEEGALVGAYVPLPRNTGAS